MPQKPKYRFFTQKITLSYLLLCLASALAVWIIYNGIRNIFLIDQSTLVPNKKLYLTSNVLTRINDAEDDARSYYLFRDKSDLNLYIKKIGEIRSGIDSITFMSAHHPKQLSSLYKIKALLVKQQEYIEQLTLLDTISQGEELFKRAFEQFYVQAYEATPTNKIITENTVIKHDSIFKKPTKDNFFKKFKKLFSAPRTKEPEISKVVVEKNITYDTIFQSRQRPDSLLKIMQFAFDKLKQQNNYRNAKIISNETEVLHNDRIVLSNLREMVSSLENEEITNSAININRSKAILHKTSESVILLGIITILLIAVFIFIIYRDIRQQKAYNQALEETHLKTKELVNTKEQFLTNMSHEIRTPLSSIIGFAEQLSRTNLTAQQYNYLDTIELSSDHLLGLVNNILDISKINAGKLELEQVRFNLEDIIREVYRNFQLTAEKKQLDLKFSFDETLQTDVIGDPLRLRQVLINLVGNAIKFTDSGTVCIHACIEKQDNQTCWVSISVADTGVGIPSEKQHEIFEAFSQADTSVTRKYGGTGLGLSIASRIVQLFNGTIQLTSAPGNGSIFSIQIPLERAIKTEKSNTHVLKAETMKLPDKLLILVVDDDHTMMMLIENMLSNAELPFDRAMNGREAIEKFSVRNYDIIFTDIHMPDISGFELLKRLNKVCEDQNRTAPPVVALTAHSQDGSAYFKSGFSGYLSKPFKEKEFLTKLYQVLFPGNDDLPNDSTEGKIVHPNQTADKLYSIHFVEEFTHGDEVALQKIIRSFVDNTRQSLSEMKLKLSIGDINAVTSIAHKLAPMFKQFQMEQIAEDLRTIENFIELGIKQIEMQKLAENVIVKASGMTQLIEEDFFHFQIKV